MSVKYISFDLDGTLADYDSFDKKLWFEEIPKLYAKKHDVSIKDAKRIVFSEYKRLKHIGADWYRPKFWFSHFRMHSLERKAINNLKGKIKVFDDVKPALDALKMKGCKLVILTHSTREFIKIKTKVRSINKYFDRTFSTIDDFCMTKKEKGVYSELLRELRIKKREIIHVGDSYEYDYEIPTSFGIKSYYLDRSGKRKGRDVVKNLREFERKINL